MPFVLLVGLGGVVGTAARYGLSASGAEEMGTFVINVVGSFLLGVLVGMHARHETATAFLGTGLLGGFTTYSALALDTNAWLRDGQIALAMAYAASTLILGLLAAMAGMATGGRGFRHTSPGAPH